MKVLIAAGGTGGHIYPALAIAEALKERRPGIAVEFVGTAHGLENRLIPAKGFVVHHLPIGRLNSNVSWRERLATVLLLPWALLKSLLLLRRSRPDFVLGVGGHASGPLLLAAAWLGCRTAVWEPNAMPGLANRILSRYVDECWVVFSEAREHLGNSRLLVAGMPVRREIEELSPVSAPTDGRFRILVFGGSQGARGINNTVAEMVKAGGEWLERVHIVHQTGASDFERVRALYGPALAAAPVELRDYLHDMADQYARADLVICRSGTGTLSELAACGKPSILIPFPFAADDHQRKNAESLVAKGAARMIVQKDLTPAVLREAIDELRLQPEKRLALAAEIRKFHHPRAAANLADKFIERIEQDAIG